MRTALIIEDEIPAAQQLRKMLTQHDIAVLDVVVSVSDAVLWFRSNSHPDIVLMDIELRDASCFKIFNQVTINAPILFTTAYDNFAIKAFEYNSIGYLLKPIRENELQKALLKLNTLTVNNYKELASMLSNDFQTSFLVASGAAIKKIITADISCFESDSNSTFIVSQQRQYPIGHSLDKLETLLDPSDFFRINRKYIINKAFITNVHSATGLQVALLHVPELLTISRARAKEFLDWYKI